MSSSLSVRMLHQLRVGGGLASRQILCQRMPSSSNQTKTPFVALTTIQKRNVHESPKYTFIDVDSTQNQTATAPNKTALILGSSGILGRNIVKHLSSDLKMTVIGADLVDPINKKDADCLDAFIPLENESGSAAELSECLSLGMKEIAGDDDEKVVVDVIICASGGWEGDPSSFSAEEEDGDGAAKAWGETLDKMMQMNLYPVMAAGHVASNHMAGEGLFVAIGAAAALNPTPGMAAYGASKAAAHHYIQTFGTTTGLGIGHKSIRKEAKRLRKHSPYLDDLTAVAILPKMIDTPSNRKFATPKDDFNTWTKPIDIAEEIGKWIVRPYLRPSSGSLVRVFPPKRYKDDNGDEKWSKSTFGLAR